ncbi:MAG: hypothetical protein ACYTG5_07075 [Planctomycetota bacterium]|jgi:hypothetical protein
MNRAFLPLFASLVIAGACANHSAATAGDSAELGGQDRYLRSADGQVLDGHEKSIVVVGYSTSYAWPDILQEMLDSHAGGERIYHVMNAVQGGAPVQMWIEEPDHPQYERTMGAMRRDFWGEDARLLGGAPQPTVAICQQSLQYTTGFPRGPVTTEYDMVGAERGADDMEFMARRLRDLGVEQVHIAMHIYKKPVEPEVGNERIALKRLIERGRGYIYEGPDVWQSTFETFPESFSEDQLHPGELGNKLMAVGWYRALAGDDASEDIIARVMSTDYDIRAMMQRYLAWRRSGAEGD